MDLLDSAAAPGSALGGGMKRGAGDDRYVFDEAAGWAAVIDGATDVGQIRLFPNDESDAAAFADMIARELVAHPAATAEEPPAYFSRLTVRLRDAAAKAAKIALADAPASSLPTAAATWVRARNGRLEGASLGDTVAIVRQPDGSVGLIGDGDEQADEQVRARRVMAMTPEQRRQWLQDVRAIHNTETGYWVFGVQPVAAAHVLHQTLPCPPGTRALLMTDGFYRLVSPYGRYTDAQLIERAGIEGLGALLTELRGLEADAADDAKIGRFKTSDDATALLVEF
ncbi:MAG: protein phosphatase 2C domain-containing protein [Alphaproteobacteria bacterium]